jgi:hypothetical protein
MATRFVAMSAESARQSLTGKFGFDANLAAVPTLEFEIDTISACQIDVFPSGTLVEKAEGACRWK